MIIRHCILFYFLYFYLYPKTCGSSLLSFHCAPFPLRHQYALYIWKSNMLLTNVIIVNKNDKVIDNDPIKKGIGVLNSIRWLGIWWSLNMQVIGELPVLGWCKASAPLNWTAKMDRQVLFVDGQDAYCEQEPIHGEFGTQENILAPRSEACLQI